MPILPSDFIITSKPLSLLNGTLDWRSYFRDGNKLPPLKRPYNGTAEVISYLSNPNSDVQKSIRTGHFPIYVHSGALQPDGTFTGGKVDEYWFRNGVDDTDLVLKNPPAATGSVVTLLPGTDNWLAPDGTLLEKIWVIENASLVVSAGRTQGATDIFSPFDTSAGNTILAIDVPIAPGGVIFFNGLLPTTTLKIYIR